MTFNYLYAQHAIHVHGPGTEFRQGFGALARVCKVRPYDEQIDVGLKHSPTRFAVVVTAVHQIETEGQLVISPSSSFCQYLIRRALTLIMTTPLVSTPSLNH